MSITSNQAPKNFVAEPFAYHQEIELLIDNLSNLGAGVGRIDDWVVFVPFSLPGEKVRARVFRNHKSYSEADLIEVIEPSLERVEPPCPLFGECGGCQYQHLNYEAQLQWKRDQVEDLLQHMAGLSIQVNATIASPNTYGYRSKITPHFQKPKNGRIEGIGFLRFGRRQQILDVAQCPIASAPINEKLIEVRKEAQATASTFKKGATLLLRDCNGVVHTDNRSIAKEQVGELTFRFLAGDFFQNNPSILPLLTSYVAQQCQPSEHPYLIDAYCGSGLFALSCASQFVKVAGVEISESSLDWARSNAETNQIENCQFIAASAETIFEQIDFDPQASALIIDPPRKGCDEVFLEQLARFKPARIVYVSCNPATQIRDLGKLQEMGYQLLEVQPFDLFPQTRHLECVITLQRTI